MFKVLSPSAPFSAGLYREILVYKTCCTKRFPTNHSYCLSDFMSPPVSNIASHGFTYNYLSPWLVMSQTHGWITKWIYAAELCRKTKKRSNGTTRRHKTSSKIQKTFSKCPQGDNQWRKTTTKNSRFLEIDSRKPLHRRCKVSLRRQKWCRQWLRQGWWFVVVFVCFSVWVGVTRLCWGAGLSSSIHDRTELSNVVVTKTCSLYDTVLCVT